MTKYNEAALRLKDFLDLKLNIQAVKLIEALPRCRQTR